MKITKIKYGRTFPLGINTYASERIDMEADIEEGQDPHQALNSLKNQIEYFHNEKHPHLYQEQEYKSVSELLNIPPHTQYQQPSYDGSLNNVIISQPIDNTPKITQEEKIKQLISQATSLPELKQWELLSKSNPILQEAYTNSLNELSGNK